MIIHPTHEIRIVSGEGEGPATVERFAGKHVTMSVKRRLTRERCHGDRWAYAVQYLRGAGPLAAGCDLETDLTRPFPSLTVDPEPKRPRGGARRGAGRPKGRRNASTKPVAKRTTERVMVRLTPDDRYVLQSYATEAGVSLSALVRRAIQAYIDRSIHSVQH